MTAISSTLQLDLPSSALASAEGGYLPGLFQLWPLRDPAQLSKEQGSRLTLGSVKFGCPFSQFLERA